MPSTTNFGWTTPADTDLVKDGASAIRTLGNGIDTTLVDLKGGTTGQVLSKNSNTDMDFTWVAQDDSNAIQNAIVDAKGDLITATAADTPSRIAVGTDGQVLTADSTQSTGLKWATPSGAVTFTQRYGIDSTLYALAYNGSNLYVAVGGNGNLATSSDGITWTARTSGFGAQTINYVAYGNGLFVAVGNNGLLSTSTDGITWTARTANMGTNQIIAVTYANSLWVAVGSGGGTTNTGGITYSSDGITWTRKSQSLTVGSSYYDVIWNGTNWIVAAGFSTNNYLYASTPSGTWTAGHTGSSQDFLRIIWDGTRHITFETGQRPRYSTSLTLGTTSTCNYGATTYANLNQAPAYLYNGKIHIGSGYWVSSFTPATSPNMLYDQIYPIGFGNATSPTYISSGLSFIWVGAVGRIVLYSTGIWTSF